MRVPCDQVTPVPIRHVLTEHFVRTAREQGWSTLSNGDLPRVAEEAGFDSLLTTDANFQHQQNLKSRKIAVVILTKTNGVSSALF